jgi:3-oxoacyl-[acyl-carrier protein] reductase
MDYGIAGKRVLVTGASQGIGRAIAIDFAKEGCKVTVVARQEEKLHQLVEMMGGTACGHSYYKADLMSQGMPTRVIEDSVQQHGSYDIVVHNVGGTLGVRDCLAPMEEWFRVTQFNVGIAMEINKLVIPAMQAQGWGRIIHISSGAAESLRGSGPYAAAKAYLNAYVTVLGRAVADTGVVVSAIMPGTILAEGGHWDTVRKDNPEKMADFIRHHQAIGRLGTAEEISPFVVFMASQQARFATASIIPVNGGDM